MKTIFAITGTIFFVTFLASIIVYGGDNARNLAVFSAFLGGVSQYVAQDERCGSASIIIAYLAMALGVIAWAFMATQ